MPGFYDLQDKIKHHFVFKGSEIRALLITIFAAAFILSFRDWGGNLFNLSTGLMNLANAFLIVGLALIVKISVQKIYALHLGYKFEYKMWIYGLIASLILCFATNGYVFFLALGGFIIAMMPGHRLGYFRYDINYYGIAVIALMGPLANLGLALFFRMFSAIPNPLIHDAMVFNALIAAFSMIPLPPFDGSKIFFGSRSLYAFSAAGIVFISAFMFFIESIPLLILSALIFAIIILAGYYFRYEFK
ncbi:MAG: hypothetical protein NTV63_01275 [Candidatus Woesearchaeota archaeon]|nr:hypothetical protein [Candidatus Woesearchaeota archaeon]